MTRKYTKKKGVEIEVTSPKPTTKVEDALLNLKRTADNLTMAYEEYIEATNQVTISMDYLANQLDEIEKNLRLGASKKE